MDDHGRDFDLPASLCDDARAAWHRFLDLVAPFRPALHAYARRLTGSVFDAEDLVQDTLLRGFATLGRMNQDVARPRAYLLRIATNLWIDTVRRRAVEASAVSEAVAGGELVAIASGERVPAHEVRAAGGALLERLPPQESAALVLKDVFELSLEEVADVLDTTVGAVKTALHRGRGRLRDPQPDPSKRRRAPSAALVDRFVALFHAGDRAGLLALMLDHATAEHVVVGMQRGRDALGGPRGWLRGAVLDHPEWPAPFQYEAQRLARAEFEGETVVLYFRTRRGREKLEQMLRLEEEDGRIARLRDYGFCPEVVRAVGDALGLPVRTGIYRYPTPEPGRSYAPIE